MFSFRVAGVVALSALLVVAGGSAFAAPASLGSGSTTGGTTVSGAVTGVTFTQVVAGVEHSLGIGSDGNAYAWGRGSDGQLGIGSSPTSSSVPVRVLAGAVPSGVTFVSVAAGTDFSLALGSDGNAYTWGRNSYGQLGDGSTTSSSVPVQVSTGAVPSGVTFTSVAAGDNFSSAVGSDGNVYAWGNNGYGQLGDGSTTSSLVPVQVSAGAVPSGVTFTSVAAGYFHLLALGTDGNAYAWGGNFEGQLGDGSTAQSLVPVQVSAGAVPSGVSFTSVDAAAKHSMALGSDGNVYAWGYNFYGWLGDGSTTSSSVPVQVSAGAVPSGVTFTSVAAGETHSLALGSDGNAYAWGSNFFGELGNNSTAQSSVPVLVSTGAVPSGVTMSTVSAGPYYSLALGSDGNAYAWGDNDYGKLGDGSFLGRLQPVPVEHSVVISGVSFDAVNGTGLTQSAGAWSIDTPAHSAGAVDVVVSYTQFGVASTQTFVGGFTYLALLAATGSPFPFLTAGSALLLLIVGSGFLVVRRAVAHRPTA